MSDRHLKAVRCEEITGSAPGSIEIRKIPGDEKISGIAFMCPCGCGQDSWLPVGQGGFERKEWHWDGNEEAPTLTPSVLNTFCGWHGFLKAGVWLPC